MSTGTGLTTTPIEKGIGIMATKSNTTTRSKKAAPKKAKAVPLAAAADKISEPIPLVLIKDDKAERIDFRSEMKKLDHAVNQLGCDSEKVDWGANMVSKFICDLDDADSDGELFSRFEEQLMVMEFYLESCAARIRKNADSAIAAEMKISRLFPKERR